MNLTDLQDAPELLQREFLGSLSSLLITEETGTYEGLLYLTRLASGCGLHLSAEDIYTYGLDFESGDLDKICTDLQEYKYAYLVEAFVVANLANASSAMFGMIADMAALMGCDKEEICVLAYVAKGKLTDDFDVLKSIPVSLDDRWEGEFYGIIPESWLASQRITCAEICVEKMVKRSYLYYPRCCKIIPCKIEGIRDYGSMVKKGTLILRYAELEGHTYTGDDAPRKIRTILAPSDGIVFTADVWKSSDVSDQNDKYLAVYLVSPFDNEDDFWEWFENK